MPIITSIVNWLNVKRIYQIDLFKKFPFDIQQEMLSKLLMRATDTEWGRKYDYASIDSVEEFQKRVPLQTYDDVKTYVSRIRNGEKDILWPGEIKWFAKSSGTTSDKSKFIPISKDCLEDCHFRGARDVLAIYMQNNPESKLFSGKGLTLGGSHKIDNYDTQSSYGDLSAILLENSPFWIEFVRTPSSEVALLDKWEEKLEKIAEETVDENVTSIAGVPSWNLVMLKYILEYTGKKNILDIWPNIELFLHGGVNFTPYREQFEKIIPTSNMHYQESYNASEGFFAIQDDAADPGMLLMLDYNIFFEFIPLEQIESKNPEVHTVGNVIKGQNYAIVISTNGGLWRYIIGDTVKFTSLDPHKIIITGRTKHFMNAFGEEIIIDNAENALKIACEKTGALITDYTAAPIFMGSDKKGTHEWLIEFEKEPENLDYFATMLDHALMSLNSDYEAKRYKNITLDSPVVRKMPKGLFYQWLEKKGKLGGQNKVPRLFNDRLYVDELLKLGEETGKIKK
ncbi:MAG: GH3 auxin-responsive promoter family protein [Bacteroidales bacterium]